MRYYDHRGRTQKVRIKTVTGKDLLLVSTHTGIKLMLTSKLTKTYTRAGTSYISTLMVRLSTAMMANVVLQEESSSHDLLQNKVPTMVFRFSIPLNTSRMKYTWIQVLKEYKYTGKWNSKRYSFRFEDS